MTPVLRKSEMEPDLEKLRRFALGAGVVLFTYALAAVEPQPGEPIRFLWFTLKINHPELLGLGLALVAGYGALRFLWYGILLTPSPRR